MHRALHVITGRSPFHWNDWCMVPDSLRFTPEDRTISSPQHVVGGRRVVSTGSPRHRRGTSLGIASWSCTNSMGFHRYSHCHNPNYSGKGQVSDLPDKEFRYHRTVHWCCIPTCIGRFGHCCRTLHVAMQIRLYHLVATLLAGVWRVVVEDSPTNVGAFPADCLHSPTGFPSEFKRVSSIWPDF